jgi:hypothetical protein
VQIDVDLAGGRFQVFSGATTDIKDVTFTIDEDGGWRKVLLDQLIRKLPNIVNAISGGAIVLKCW